MPLRRSALFFFSFAVNRLICLIVVTLILGPAAPFPLAAQGRWTAPGSVESTVPAAPDAAEAARLIGIEERVTLLRHDEPPGWVASTTAGEMGYIASTWEVTGSIGYSGRPIDILVAITPDARIAGARLVRQDEPVLTLGISPDDIAAYVDGFSGVDLTRPQITAFGARSDLPPVIPRATVSTGVIRDAILRTARAVALGHGLIGGPGALIDRTRFEPRSWDELVQEGALAHKRITMDEARAGLAGAASEVASGDGTFLELWVALLDPPTIGRNLLGQVAFTRATAGLGPDDSLLLIASRGLHSHRGVDWLRSGVFDRIEVQQGEETIALTRDDYHRIDELADVGAPELKEISLFRLRAERFDPAAPFRVEIAATRPAEGGGTVTFRMPLDYSLPARYRLEPVPAPDSQPLWVSAWENKRGSIIGVTLMLGTLTGILFFQDAFMRRPRLWFWGRTAFLVVTFVWLGLIVGGQLSIVHVVAFVNSLLSGFRWETFLIEPVIFLLWSFVALGLLFWGRGVFCGWLCPFGALQELLYNLAKRLGVPSVTEPPALHERLWVIKYTFFVAILGLSLYSMHDALILSEVEPFKTTIMMWMMRSWPFVAFALAVLTMGLFIERAYCRYLCPLGAGLAIPAKLKIFDWLKRRPQCGRECRLCETKCTVGAIDPIGRINPNECILCLRCQMIYADPNTCPVLKRRLRPAPAPKGTPA